MSETVVWMRRRKGGNREITPIPVRVVGRTTAGAYVVEITRRYRTRREIVAKKNIRPLVEIEVRTA